MPAIRYPTRYRKLPARAGRARRLPRGVARSCSSRRPPSTTRSGPSRCSSATFAPSSPSCASRCGRASTPRTSSTASGSRTGAGRRPFRRSPRTARPLVGKHLRSATLAILATNDRPMTLVEIHRELHLNGYAIASRFPVKRLADALGYETRLGRAQRVERGVVRDRPVESGHAPASGQDPATARARPRPSARPRRWDSSRPARPAAESASIFACAVPLEPDTIAPA